VSIQIYFEDDDTQVTMTGLMIIHKKFLRMMFFCHVVPNFLLMLAIVDNMMVVMKIWWWCRSDILILMRSLMGHIHLAQLMYPAPYRWRLWFSELFVY
jgi:hypothetical protein